MLDDQLTEIAAELSQAASGNFRQSMLSNSQQTNNVYKAAIDKLYADLPLDTHLESARKRVGWHFSAHEHTKRISLDVVCLPYNWQKNADKEGALFSIQQADRFLYQLIQYCEYELRNVNTHITTAWFDENVDPQVDFLARNLTLLGYDAEKLHKEFDSEVGQRFGYLVSRNDDLANKYAVSTFSNLPDETVNPIASGERTRISKIEITVNIPLSTVTKYLATYQDYKFADARHLHLYPQEQNANYFEKKIRSLGWGQKDIRLTPQITMMLADKSLVDLFFQALFTGVITQYTIMERFLGEEQWGIIKIGEFSRVDLAAIQEGILGAFRSFVLELPNTNLEMPHPFHPRLRQKYLEIIRNEVQKRQSIQEYQKHYAEAKNNLLPEIEKLGELDTSQRDIAEIMKVELESPWDFTY